MLSKLKTFLPKILLLVTVVTILVVGVSAANPSPANAISPDPCDLPNSTLLQFTDSVTLHQIAPTGYFNPELTIMNSKALWGYSYNWGYYEYVELWILGLHFPLYEKPTYSVIHAGPKQTLGTVPIQGICTEVISQFPKAPAIKIYWGGPWHRKG